MIKYFDVVIVGGGIVGLTLANLLAKTTLRIALIDQSSPPSLPDLPDKRVSSIHPGSHSIFQSIPSVWKEISGLRVSSYNSMEVCDVASPARLEFNARELARPCLGWILEHSVMKWALWKALEMTEVQIYSNSAPLSLQKETITDASGFQKQTKPFQILALEKESIAATLLIGADGRQSWVAQQTGLLSESIYKDEAAVVATIYTEKPHQHTAYQRFLPTGPVALLPLSDSHLMSLVWSTHPRQAKHLYELEEKAFIHELEQAVAYRFGTLSLKEARHIFPLVRHEATHYVKEGVALIGDAAHTILPLAGQGLNLGLADAACLAEMIMTAHTAQRHFAGLPILQKYARERRVQNRQMHRMMEGLFALFSNERESVRHLRAAGFTIANKMLPLKWYFMKQGMGL